MMTRRDEVRLGLVSVLCCLILSVRRSRRSIIYPLFHGTDGSLLMLLPHLDIMDGNFGNTTLCTFHFMIRGMTAR